MPEHKKQHYLPRFYLEGFSIEENFNGVKQNLIWYYSKETKELKRKSIENIAHKPYYYSYKDQKGEYDLSVEKYFGYIEFETSKVIKQLEDDFRVILKRYNNRDIDLLKLRGLSNDEKNTLILFIFYMLKRVPAYVEYVEESWKKKYTELLIKHNREFDSNEFKKVVIELLMDIGASGDMNYVKLFNSKNIEFIYNPFFDSTFLTIDDPFININLNQKPGFVYKDTNIFFPLSSRLIIRFYDFGSSITLSKVDSNKRLFSINGHIASLTYKYIFCRSKLYLNKIVKELRKTFNGF